MEHIKTPVQCKRWDIGDCHGSHVAGFETECQAAEAARAINAYDALVAALKRALLHIEHEASEYQDWHTCGPNSLCDANCSARRKVLETLEQITNALHLTEGE